MSVSRSRFPLHKAIRSGTCSDLKDLLDCSSFAPVDHDDLDLSPIHLVACTKFNWPNRTSTEAALVVLDLLLDHYAKKSGWQPASVLKIQGQVTGYTILHWVVLFRECELLDRLMELGADATIRNQFGYLPIHLAAMGKRILPRFCLKLKLFLETRFDSPASSSAETFIQSFSQRCPELKAEEHQFLAGVPTPAQVAASRCCYEALKTLREEGFSFESHCGKSVHQFVIESGDSDEAVTCLQFLCRSFPAWMIGNTNKESTLYTAARMKTPRLMRTLLDNSRHLLAIRNSYRMTSLHLLSYSSEPKSVECAQVILDKKYHPTLAIMCSFLRRKNASGQMALDICIQERNVAVAKVILLSTYGYDQSLDLGVHYWLESSILQKLYAHIPEALLPILDMSYECQWRRKYKDEGYQFDYSVITGVCRDPDSDPAPKLTDSALLHKLVTREESGVEKTVLLHPLPKRLIAQHWAKYAPFVYASAIVQFVILVTYVLATVVCNNCYSDRIGDANNSFDSGSSTAYVSASTDASAASVDCCCKGGTGFPGAVVALLFVFLLLVKEFLQLLRIGLPAYFGSEYNRYQVGFGMTACASLFQWLFSISVQYTWLVSIVAIQFACLVAIFQLRNLPAFGISIMVSILWQVFWRSIKLLAILGLPIILTFSATFVILVRKDTFQSLDYFGVPVKVLVMMTGELSFDGIVQEVATDTFNLHYYAALIIFALFALVATVVFLNLLVAMAVDITQDVQLNAAAVRAMCQLEQVQQWEATHPIIRDNLPKMLKVFANRWRNLKSCFLCPPQKEGQTPGDTPASSLKEPVLEMQHLLARAGSSHLAAATAGVTAAHSRSPPTTSVIRYVNSAPEFYDGQVYSASA